MNAVTMKLNADDLILQALKEDITGEDITTNSVMPHFRMGEVELICKEDGVIAGLEVFGRVFQLLDEKTEITFSCQDGDRVKKGERLGLLRAGQARWMARAALLDACGSAWVEAGCDGAQAEISARFPGLHPTDRFSPGYGDLPLSLQRDICGALDAPRRLGVQVTDSLLLNPCAKKAR